MTFQKLMPLDLSFTLYLLNTTRPLYFLEVLGELCVLWMT